MKKLLAMMALLCELWCGPVWANDSAFSGVSGTPKPMRGEHASIAMQSERIVIVSDSTRVSTLRVGAQTLAFAPNVATRGSQNRALLLHGNFGDTLYAPLAEVAKKLGSTFETDVKSRLFSLKLDDLKGR